MQEPWIIGILVFHVIMLGTSVATRKKTTVQGVIFAIASEWCGKATPRQGYPALVVGRISSPNGPKGSFMPGCNGPTLIAQPC